MKHLPRIGLMLAILVAGALPVACGDDAGDKGSADGTPGAASPTVGEGDEDVVELELTAENTQFDKDSLEVPAGSDVALTLDNRDSAEHNFSLYETEQSEDPLVPGQIFSGPSFLTYQFTAPEEPGRYHFRCQIHPDAMRGEFIVE